MNVQSASLFRVPQRDYEVSDDFHYGGKLNAWIVLREVPRETVEESLPDFVTLAPNETIPEAIRPEPRNHPVIFLCGRYHGVSPVPRIPVLPSNLDYLEAACVVPYTLGCGDTPRNYPTSVYLEDPRGVLLGWVGAINKYFANLTMKWRSFTVDELFDISDTPLVKLTERKRRTPGAAAKPRLDAIRDIFTHPILGSYTDSIKKSLGLQDVVDVTFIRVCEEMHYDLGRNLKATDIELIVDRKFEPPIGVSGLIPGIDQDKFGAFSVKNCQWRLFPPKRC